MMNNETRDLDLHEQWMGWKRPPPPIINSVKWVGDLFPEWYNILNLIWLIWFEFELWYLPVLQKSLCSCGRRWGVRKHIFVNSSCLKLLNFNCVYESHSVYICSKFDWFGSLGPFALLGNTGVTYHTRLGILWSCITLVWEYWGHASHLSVGILGSFITLVWEY